MDIIPPPELEMEKESPAGSSIKTLTENALEANKAHQYALTNYAERLTADLQEVDKLLSAVDTNDREDEPAAEIQIPGAKKAAGPCPLSEFLNPDSPFFEDASRRTRYINHTTAHPMKAKELDTLADAVRSENQRLRALELQKSSQGLSSAAIDLDNNTEGIDWTKIAEKVSSLSNIKRTADQCRIKWLGDRHPRINHKDWTSDELDTLTELVTTQVEENDGKVDWVYVATKLGTNRTPVDCMRHGFPRQRHTWNHVSDQKLFDAVQLYGTDNWSIVARVVSEDATSAQCQGRYFRALDPSLKRGAWSEAELARLKVATEAYGNSWVEVAACMPGRTNEQCRERWMEHLNMFTGKEAWSEDDDEALMNAVNSLGNQWKAISMKLGKERTGAQCRLRYEKLKKLKALQAQAAPSSTTPTAKPGQSSNSNTTAPPSKVKSRAKKDNGTAIPKGKNVEPPPAAPRPKPRPVGKKGKEKEVNPATTKEATSNDLERPNPAGDETVSPTQRKREATQDLDGAPPSKKKRTTRKSDRNMDTHPQNAVDAGGSSKNSRKPIRKRARRTAATGSTPQNDVSEEDPSSPVDTQRPANDEAADPQRIEVEKPNPRGRLKITLRVGSQSSSEAAEASTAVPEDAPKPAPKPKPRGHPKKAVATSTHTRQSSRRATEPDTQSSTLLVDAEAASTNVPDPNPKPKGRKKIPPLPESLVPTSITPDVATKAPPTSVSRRQSARVAAKK